MPEAVAKNGQFEPLHAAHAIEQVIFVVQFDRPLDDDPFLQALKTAEQFKEELPGEIQMQGVTFMIGASPGMPSNGQAAGKWFRRSAPNGVIENDLRVERVALTFVTTLYTRWDTVWAQARKYFSVLLPIYATKAKIASISLNYIDKFSWRGDMTDCRPNLLLRPDSKYLCPHVFQADDFWHSHTGAFVRVDQNTKRLVNINVDYLDEPRADGPRRIVSVTTIITDLLNQVGYEPIDVASDHCVDFLDAHMRMLHISEKDILGNIVNDEMCKRIALVD